MDSIPSDKVHFSINVILLNGYLTKLNLSNDKKPKLINIVKLIETIIASVEPSIFHYLLL